MKRASAFARLRGGTGPREPGRWRPWITGLALVVLALPVCAPFVTTRLPGGHDAMAQLPRLVELHENIRHGILLPRWAPDLSGGFGQPFFLFYPPMTYYIGEFWHLLGFDFVTSLNLVAMSLVLASSSTVFLLAGLYFGRGGGLIAAASYLYAPYFHVDLFVRSSLAESAALAFFPLTLYGFGRFAQEGAARWLVLGAAAYAAVMYSHHPAALLFTPLLLAFLAFAAWQARSVRAFAWGLGGLLLGLGLAASFWLPALLERRYVAVEAARVGYFSYANHFVFPWQLLHSSWRYGRSVAGPADAMSFSLGWAHLLLALLAGIAAWRALATPERRWQGFFASATLGLCFLMSPGSAWLWDRLPLLHYVQFPWRLLGPTALCLALVIAPIGRVLWPPSGSRRFAFASLVGLLVLANVGHAHPKRYRVIDLDAWTAQEIAKRDGTATLGEVFAPRWVRRRAPFRPERIRVVDGAVEIDGLSRTPNRWRAQLTAQEDSLLELSLSYYPGWRAWLSGKEVALEPERETGLIRFRVPAGDHRLEVRFTRTWLRLAADGLSLLAAAALGLLCYRGHAGTP